MHVPKWGEELLLIFELAVGNSELVGILISMAQLLRSSAFVQLLRRVKRALFSFPRSKVEEEKGGGETRYASACFASNFEVLRCSTGEGTAVSRKWDEEGASNENVS